MQTENARQLIIRVTFHIQLPVSVHQMCSDVYCSVRAVEGSLLSKQKLSKNKKRRSIIGSCLMWNLLSPLPSDDARPVASGGGSSRSASRRKRTSFSKEHVELLRATFETDPYPGISLRESLSQTTGLPESRIQVHSRPGYVIQQNPCLWGIDVMMKYNKLSCLESVKFAVQISVSLFGKSEIGVVPGLNIHMHAFHINTYSRHKRTQRCIVVL